MTVKKKINAFFFCIVERSMCRPMRWCARKMPRHGVGLIMQVLFGIAVGLLYCYGVSGSTVLIVKFRSLVLRVKKERQGYHA